MRISFLNSSRGDVDQTALSRIPKQVVLDFSEGLRRGEGERRDSEFHGAARNPEEIATMIRSITAMQARQKLRSDALGPPSCRRS